MIGITNATGGGGIRGENLNISLTSNQSDKSDLIGSVIAVTLAEETTEYTWEGSDLNVTIPPYVQYSVKFPEIEGYKTPETVTYTGIEGNSRTISGEYLAEKVSVVLQTDDSASVSGQVVTINGKQHTYGSSAVEQLVPYDTEYTIAVDNKEYYAAPSSVSRKAQAASYPVTMTYKASKLTVSITSNQSNDTTIAATKATVTWTGASKSVGNGETIQIPTDKTVTVTFPTVTGYATPSAVTVNNTSGGTASASGQYKCSVVAVTLADNQTSYNDISSAKATVSGSASATLSSGGTVKVPWGGSITITGSAVDGYNTPSTTYEAADVTKAITLTYTTHILTVNVVGSGATPSGYTITVKNKSTGAVIGTQTASSKVYKIPYGVNYIVSAGALTGYNAVTDQEGNSNSQSNSITVTYVYNPTVDLSKQNIYGNTISQTTANCYVVKEAGDYKFPLVYGNALKNGSTNSAAYTKNSGSYSHDFVTHDGTVITSPYIETMEGSAASAQLTIADTDGVFTDISIVDGSPCRYVQFSVASVPATGANGVISIKNSSGVIMWSWHIWVWTDDLSVVEITNSTSVKYNILPVNLGSKWDDTAKTKIKNWFYQFGRPTPLLCPSAYNSTSNHASYGALSFTTASIAANLYNGIQNPTTFYKYSSDYNYNWFSANSGKTYNLWDAACTTTGNSDNDVTKTVYDPCPVGFKMPNGNTFTYFSKSNVVGSFANGWKFKRYSGDTVGVFFPASGYRSISDGSLRNVGSDGCVWLSSAGSQDDACRLYFDSSYVNPQYDSRRAGGFSVRPVQDSLTEIDTI